MKKLTHTLLTKTLVAMVVTVATVRSYVTLARHTRIG